METMPNEMLNTPQANVAQILEQQVAAERQWIRASFKSCPRLRWKWTSEADEDHGFTSRHAAAENGRQKLNGVLGFIVKLDTDCWYPGTPSYLYNSEGELWGVSWAPVGFVNLRDPV